MGFRSAFFLPKLIGQVFAGVLFSALSILQDGLLNCFLHATEGTPLDTQCLNKPNLVCQVQLARG